MIKISESSINILLPIKPKYVEMMRKGTKRVELRRRFCKDFIDRIFIYETSPVQRITSYIEPTSIEKLPVDELWEKTKNINGVSKEEFDKYFSPLERGIGIFFNHITLLPKPKTLEEVHLCAPQDYRFLFFPDVKRLLNI